MERIFMQGSMASSRVMHERAAASEGAGTGSKPLDEAGVDQQPVEAPRLRAAGTGVEQPLAALENALLLGEGGIERQASRLLDDERKIRPLDRVERGGEVDGPEVDGVDGVKIGRASW